MPQRRDPDRLLPLDPDTRAIARDLYSRVKGSPIISPHGHVPAQVLVDNTAFSNATDLIITDDHYITRLLHSAGVDLTRLQNGSASTDPRLAWKILAEHWIRFAGTASGYWIEEELSGVLGINLPISPETADPIYDAISARLSTPEFQPRALFDRFNIEFLATTDDPLDDLSAHSVLAQDGLRGRIVPTFRPDRYLDPDAAGFTTSVQDLVSHTGHDLSFRGYIAALEERRAYFIDHGAVSTDHGVEEPLTVDLEPLEAAALFQAIVTGQSDASQRRVFRAHMLLQMARMSTEDGLVMTLHAGILRNHSTATLDRFGPDTGHDIPVPISFTRGLRPLLERFGLVPGFHLVVFAVDETVYSRELAPLAGFYPSVYAGAPWWFLDAPDAIARFRSAVTETAGFYKTSGFIDDTRAFLSIPARHDTARRADASFLARYVREGRLNLPTAERIISDLVSDVPKKVFKL